MTQQIEDAVTYGGESQQTISKQFRNYRFIFKTKEGQGSTVE